MTQHQQRIGLNNIRRIIRRAICEVYDSIDVDAGSAASYDPSASDDEQLQHLSGYDAAYMQQTVQPDSADHDYIADFETSGKNIVRRRSARKKV